MIRDRGDWLSLANVLGVFHFQSSMQKTVQLSRAAETIEYVAQLFEVHGSSIWWERDAKDLLPEGFTSRFSKWRVKKETDIMDVWFDSGSSWNGVFGESSKTGLSADLYLEGS